MGEDQVVEEKDRHSRTKRHFQNLHIRRKKLKDIFRIFTYGGKNLEAQTLTNVEGEKIRLATDGSCQEANTINAKAGAGIFLGLDNERNRALRVPNDLLQTNQVGEMYAALEAVKLFPGDETLEILSDSKYVIKALTSNLEKNEDRGFIGVANKDLVRQTVAALRNRRGKTHFKWVKGHQGDLLNEGADNLASQGCDQEATEFAAQEVNQRGSISGAKLQSLNQTLAYKGIREIELTKAKHKQEKTAQMLSTIQDHLADSCGTAPNENQIWKEAKSKDLSRQTRFFLWMSIHDAYKVGRYWTNTVGGDYTERGVCPHCNGEVEDMSHILTQCETPGQAEIWRLAKGLWEKKGYAWSQPKIGDILGCGNKPIKNEEGKLQRGDMRFWRILIAESAYLIWKLRCTRVIQDENRPISQREVRNKWNSMINERLDLDRKMSHKRYKKKALKTKTVLETWRGVLLNEISLPKNWIDSGGVLVGSDLQTHQENG
ncbi:hypothetical protein PTI98_010865 [Pleurotus ostreatus]|nr:hypothetical protein PTI98_010865 [Pleurotus ostreatus]